VDLGVVGVTVSVNSAEVGSCCGEVLVPSAEVQADRRKPVVRNIPITILDFIHASTT
jgi:hypothetical protein